MTIAVPRKRVVIYPTTKDDMGESMLQRLIVELLRPLIQRYLEQVLLAGSGEMGAGKRARELAKSAPHVVGADQFLYYLEEEPKKCVAPDVYVLSNTTVQDAESWSLWELAAAPLFALEVVGQDFDKDYRKSPEAYGLTGVRELVVFDPKARALNEVLSGKRGKERVRWQVWRRTTGGAWIKSVESNGDRVKSEALHCWIRAVGTGVERRLRLATGKTGANLVRMSDEHKQWLLEREVRAKEREVRAKEREVRAKEREVRAKEREAVLRKQAEAALASALAEIKRLRAKSR